jgi:hypothetical protein
LFTYVWEEPITPVHSTTSSLFVHCACVGPKILYCHMCCDLILCCGAFLHCPDSSFSFDLFQEADVSAKQWLRSFSILSVVMQEIQIQAPCKQIRIDYQLQTRLSHTVYNTLFCILFVFNLKTLQSKSWGAMYEHLRVVPPGKRLRVPSCTRPEILGSG